MTQPPPPSSYRKLACDSCRRSKVRCDGQEGYSQCTRCIKREQECTWNTPRCKRGRKTTHKTNGDYELGLFCLTHKTLIELTDHGSRGGRYDEMNEERDMTWEQVSAMGVIPPNNDGMIGVEQHNNNNNPLNPLNHQQHPLNHQPHPHNHGHYEYHPNPHKTKSEQQQRRRRKNSTALQMDGTRIRSASLAEPRPRSLDTLPSETRITQGFDVTVPQRPSSLDELLLVRPMDILPPHRFPTFVMANNHPHLPHPLPSSSPPPPPPNLVSDEQASVRMKCSIGALVNEVDQPVQDTWHG